MLPRPPSSLLRSSPTCSPTTHLDLGSALASASARCLPAQLPQHTLHALKQRVGHDALLPPPGSRGGGGGATVAPLLLGEGRRLLWDACRRGVIRGERSVQGDQWGAMEARVRLCPARNHMLMGNQRGAIKVVRRDKAQCLPPGVNYGYDLHQAATLLPFPPTHPWRLRPCPQLTSPMAPLGWPPAGYCPLRRRGPRLRRRRTRPRAAAPAPHRRAAQRRCRLRCPSAVRKIGIQIRGRGAGHPALDAAPQQGIVDNNGKADRRVRPVTQPSSHEKEVSVAHSGCIREVNASSAFPPLPPLSPPPHPPLRHPV